MSSPPPTTPRPLDPRVRTLWWITALLWAAAASAGAVAAELILVPEHAPPYWPVGWLARGVPVFAFALALLVPPLRYGRWRFALRAHDIWIRHGILWVTVSVIPYSRIQFADTEQGPLERLFGLSSLVVHTAAPGTSGRLPGLDATQAEELRERLARVQDPGADEPT